MNNLSGFELSNWWGLFSLSWMLFGPVLLILFGLTLLGNEFIP